MATSSTLDAGEPADSSSSIDETGYVPAETQEVKTCPPPLTDFFAYPSIEDEDADPNKNKTSNLSYGVAGDDLKDQTTKCKILKRVPKWQITCDDACFKITPAVGAVCYEYFSLSVMDPIGFSRSFGASECTVKNTVWLYAHLGAALYLYSRRHIKQVTTQKKVFYSVFGSVLFNFGSLMLWGWQRRLMPDWPLTRISLGLVTGGALLYVAQDYLQYVDNSCSEVD